jgi:hypothetical protein
MKPLTESLENVAPTRSLGSASSRAISTTESTTVSEASSDSITTTRGGSTSESFSGGDDDELVTVAITSTSGYADSEVFELPDRKAAKAFARSLMAAAVRASKRAGE